MPATQSFTIPPVISVNGQVVSGGQPVDLAAFMGPAAAQQVASVLTQFGVNLGGMMGAHATNAANAGYAAGMSAPPVTAQSAPSTYVGTPGEIRPSNASVRWLAALVVLGSLALIIYLSVAN